MSKPAHNPLWKIRSVSLPYCLACLALLLLTGVVQAQTCQTAADMQPAVRTALETTAKRYFGLIAQGQTPALQQSAIPSLASSFAGVEALVKENQTAFASAQASVRPPFLLTADGSQ